MKFKLNKNPQALALPTSKKCLNFIRVSNNYDYYYYYAVIYSGTDEAARGTQSINK